MLSADKHSQISQISQLQMGENFSGATEISDAVWKIEVSEWNSSVFSAKFVTEYTTGLSIQRDLNVYKQA